MIILDNYFKWLYNVVKGEIVMQEIFDSIYSEDLHILATNIFLFTFCLDFVLCMFNIIKGGIKTGRS